MRAVIFSQCRDRRMGVVWLNLGALTTARARELVTRISVTNVGLHCTWYWLAAAKLGRSVLSQLYQHTYSNAEFIDCAFVHPVGWLGSRVVSVLDSGAVRPGFKSQPWRWSRFSAVSLQVTWVLNPPVGCHYFPPGMQLPSQPFTLGG